MKCQRQLLWFFFGLGGQLQVFGTSLCFTEIFVYAATPFLFLSEVSRMRRTGAMNFFVMSILLLLFGTFSGILNQTQFSALLRGEAVLCLLPCSIIVCHWMLRMDMENFKWALIGGLFSGIVSTFVFQNSFLLQSAGETAGMDAAEEIMNGPLWIIGRVGDFALLYPKGWYMQCPIVLSAFLPVAFAAFSLFVSVSGRGTSVRSLCSAVLVLLGGNKMTTIRRRVCGHFWTLCVVGVLAVVGFKTFYQYAASSGLLGERARVKYESQTRGDKSMLALIMGGRMESFCGLIAAIDRPILGFGPWAVDTHGYTGDFLAKYGQDEDYRSYVMSRQFSSGSVLIPCHSYLTQFWLWYGVLGLLFWLYVMFLIIRYLKQDCYAVPQYFMWLAAGAPAYFWNIFFNPFSNRVESMMYVVAILMVRAVRLGRQQLPSRMQLEILRAEQK